MMLMPLSLLEIVSQGNGGVCGGGRRGGWETNADVAARHSLALLLLRGLICLCVIVCASRIPTSPHQTNAHEHGCWVDWLVD